MRDLPDDLHAPDLRASHDALAAMAGGGASPASVERATRRTSAAVRRQLDLARRRADVGAEADASSHVWRYARWPLAAAALLVVGLVALTYLRDPTLAPDRLADRGATPAPVEAVAVAEEKEEEATWTADDVAAAFDLPSFGWAGDDDNVDPSAAVARLDADLDELAQLADAEADALVDWASELDG